MIAKLLTLLVLLSFVVSTPVAATIIEVNWSGGGDHTTIQDGVNAAGEGDTVLVMAGTYTGAGNINIDFAGTNAVLLGQGGAMNVTIDCGGAGRAFYFHSWETSDCVVEGLTITNGSQVYGGAMYFINSTPTIRDCVITENTASIRGGGAVCTSMGDPTFDECTFSSNSAPLGGGVSCEVSGNPFFDRCTFTNNTTTDGGGAAHISDAYPSFLVCGFHGNTVTGDFRDGGAMYIEEGAAPWLSGCTFNSNSSTLLGGAVLVRGGSYPEFSGCLFGSNLAGQSGGAVGMYESSSPTLSYCWFSGNGATMSGGAVVVQDGSTPSFDGCTFDNNSALFTGGALSFEYIAEPTLTQCTLYANSAPEGSGIWCDANFSMDNCIIAFGITGEAVHCVGDSPEPACSDIYGNAGGDWVGCLAGLDMIDNNFSEDPLFCNAPGGIFHIDVASPCTADNVPACGQVGAWGIDCDSPVKARSWGEIKAMYR